jgi:hypothetical protein
LAAKPNPNSICSEEGTSNQGAFQRPGRASSVMVENGLAGVRRGLNGKFHCSRRSTPLTQPILGLSRVSKAQSRPQRIKLSAAAAKVERHSKEEKADDLPSKKGCSGNKDLKQSGVVPWFIDGVSNLAIPSTISPSVISNQTVRKTFPHNAQSVLCGQRFACQCLSQRTVAV